MPGKDLEKATNGDKVILEIVDNPEYTIWKELTGDVEGWEKVAGSKLQAKDLDIGSLDIDKAERNETVQVRDKDGKVIVTITFSTINLQPVTTSVAKVTGDDSVDPVVAPTLALTFDRAIKKTETVSFVIDGKAYTGDAQFSSDNKVVTITNIKTLGINAKVADLVSKNITQINLESTNGIAVGVPIVTHS